MTFQCQGHFVQSLWLEYRAKARRRGELSSQRLLCVLLLPHWPNMLVLPHWELLSYPACFSQSLYPSFFYKTNKNILKNQIQWTPIQEKQVQSKFWERERAEVHAHTKHRPFELWEIMKNLWIQFSPFKAKETNSLWAMWQARAKWLFCGQFIAKQKEIFLEHCGGIKNDYIKMWYIHDIYLLKQPDNTITNCNFLVSVFCTKA
jgi:hypothetical protein